MTIMPSLTYLSMMSLTIPPPIRNAPTIKNPKEFRVWAARRPVKSVLNGKIRAPIHMKRIPSRIAAMIRFFENRDWNTWWTGSLTGRISLPTFAPQFKQNLESVGISAPHLLHLSSTIFFTSPTLCNTSIVYIFWLTLSFCRKKHGIFTWSFFVSKIKYSYCTNRKNHPRYFFNSTLAFLSSFCSILFFLTQLRLND